MSEEGIVTLIVGQLKSLINEIDQEMPHDPRGLMAQEALHSAIGYLRRKE
jgi:hypothetical protein